MLSLLLIMEDAAMEFEKIVSIISGIMVILSFIGIFTGKGKQVLKALIEKKGTDKQQSDDIKEIKANVKEIINRLEPLEESAKQQNRNILKNIYYSYYHAKKIPLYERKTADSVYNVYVNELHGNSYATLLYNEICKWEITNDSDNDKEHNLNEDLD